MAETITMPKLGFDMQEGTLVRWVRNEGENINKGDVLAEIETDKATVEVESSATGVIRRLLVDKGAVVPIGAPIAIVGTKEEKVPEQAPAAGKPQAGEKPAPAAAGQPSAAAEPPTMSAARGLDNSAAAAVQQAGSVKASPLAKRMARDEGLNLASLKGTGPGGRIVRKDIAAALSSRPQAAASHPASTSILGPPSTAIVSREDETVVPTRLRQAIARRMTESKTTAPHFYVSHEYRMDVVVGLRKQINEFLPDDEKLSINDFIVKAVALTLRQFPNLNSSFVGDRVLRHGAVNIGVAVAVENGLLTVVSKDADQKPVRLISAELKRMADGARGGRVKPEDIEGSTFSISNLGMFDVENFIAILNPPEAAMLAVGSAREVPVVAEGGEIRAGWRMKATVSVDHRVSDGAEAARFMQAMAAYLEEPLRLFV